MEKAMIKESGIKFTALILLALLTFSATAEINVPDTVRDQITSEVMTEAGYYDAVEIEDRIRLWILEQPQPRSSGELLESGDCVSSCEQTSGDATLPMPRKVKYKGRIKEGKYTQNLIM